MAKKSNIIIGILNAVAQTVGETIYSMTPGLLIRESLYYKDLRMAGHDPKKLEQTFKNLRQRGFIRSDSNKIHFTKKGKHWLDNSYRRYFMFTLLATDK